MKKQTIIELEIKIRRIVDAHQKLDAAFEPAIEAGCIDIDGGLYNGVYEAFNKMMEVCGDDRDWIEWFMYDNDCGKKGLRAGANGDIKPIKTARDLARVILAEKKP